MAVTKGGGSRRTSTSARKGVSGALLLLPGLAVLIVFFIYPIFRIALRSLDPDGRLNWPPSFTLANYQEIAGDPAFRLILEKTFVIALEATVVAVMVAYPVAFFLSRLPRRYGQPLLLLALFPFWTSILIRLYAFTQLLGSINLLYTTAATVIGMVHYLLPYMIAVLYATMVTIDSELLRAAKSLGANDAQGMRYVFLPLSRTGLYAGTLFIFVIALGFYLTPAILGASSDVTIAIYIQQQVENYQWGIAGAMGIFLLAITLGVFVWIERNVGVEQVVGASSGGQKGTASAVGVHWSWSTIGLAIYTGLVLVFLLGPLVVVVLVSFTPTTYLTWPPVGFSLRWYREFFSDPTWLASAWLSLRIACLTVIMSTTLGLAAAYALERFAVAGRTFIRAMFIAPLIVPVILVAATLFELLNRYGLADTIPGYVIGHTILALPFTVVLLSAALRNIGTGLEEASRTLGANAWKTVRYVTVPAIAPSLAAAAIFAFITSWDEVVVSLFLSGANLTLPVHLFEFLRQQLRPTIAAISTLLMAGILLLIVIWWVVSRLASKYRVRTHPT